MSLIVAMCVYSFSMSVSPGPVNLITLSTGISHGFKRALPFVFGASIGFTLLLYSVGLFFYQATTQSNEIIAVLKVLGSLYILYLGYSVIKSKPEINVADRNIPSFYQGILLQWLNPKAWMASIAGVSAFTLSDSHNTLILFVSIYFVICYCCIAAWAALGSKLILVFKTKEQIKIFNLVMGLSLITTAIYLFIT